jgi:hypothetical protein
MKEFFLIKDVANDRWFLKLQRGGIGWTYAPVAAATRMDTYAQAQTTIDVSLPGGTYQIEKYFAKKGATAEG